MVLEIGIHTLSIRVDEGPGFGVERRVFQLGYLSPAQRAQEGIGFHLPAAEHFGELTGADMAPGIHLPEAVLGMDVPLGKEQVVLGPGIDVRDAHLVPVNIHGAIEAFQLDLPGDLWKRLRRNGIRQVTLEVIRPSCSGHQCKHDN